MYILLIFGGLKIGIEHSQEAYVELKKLIYTNKKHTERKCKEYLKYIPGLLVDETFLKIIHYDIEYPGTKGDSDIVISALVRTEGDEIIEKAYIWETKAPQCYVFKLDTYHRLCPSSDLYSAENQLLNYYVENKINGQFCDDFGVQRRNICLGGIIIGRNDTKIKIDKRKKIPEKSRLYKLYSQAYSLRNNYFWQPNGIRCLTWDIVLEQLKPSVVTTIEKIEPEIISETPYEKGELHISDIARVPSDWDT